LSDEAAANERVGLALSGGGFRAAFFHIGVLARLAELGILPKVEVISTVSGGSIVGALYYLHVKNLLEEKPDADIDHADYVELVQRLEHDFLQAVGKNVRSRAFANIAKNFAMARPSYSRSDRIGDLFDRYFYKPAWRGDRPRKWWGAETQIEMGELLIRPKGDPNEHDFKPRDHNAHRTRAKVPMLVINATSLNTGHNWRFEATRMGEPLPADERTRALVEDADKNRRFAQADYDQLGRQQDFPLALAVAASACVPMLFHPLAISGMYDGATVQLVDGGVHDNQGVQGLLDLDCTHMIVSDASGQMSDDDKPITRIPAVARRSISIYGDSLRDEQLLHVQGDKRYVALMHLRKGLTAEVVFPLDDSGRPLQPPQVEREGDISCRAFEVDLEVQRRLARVRTDLDSFSEVEAYSLALDAYRMSSQAIACVPAIAGLGNDGPRNEQAWGFGAVRELIERPTEPYLRRLDAANQRFFKLLALRPGLRFLPRLVAAVALVALLWWRRDDMLDAHVPIWVLALVGLALASYFALGTVPVLRQVSSLMTSILGPIVLAIPLWFGALAVLLLHRAFLVRGKARTVTHAPEAVPSPGTAQ
jgi:NTE family protein